MVLICNDALVRWCCCGDGWRSFSSFCCCVFDGDVVPVDAITVLFPLVAGDDFLDRLLLLLGDPLPRNVDAFDAEEDLEGVSEVVVVEGELRPVTRSQNVTAFSPLLLGSPLVPLVGVVGVISVRVRRLRAAVFAVTPLLPRLLLATTAPAVAAALTRSIAAVLFNGELEVALGICLLLLLF